MGWVNGYTPGRYEPSVSRLLREAAEENTEAEAAAEELIGQGTLPIWAADEAERIKAAVAAINAVSKAAAGCYPYWSLRTRKERSLWRRSARAALATIAPVIRGVTADSMVVGTLVEKIEGLLPEGRIKRRWYAAECVVAALIGDATVLGWWWARTFKEIARLEESLASTDGQARLLALHRARRRSL